MTAFAGTSEILVKLVGLAVTMPGLGLGMAVATLRCVVIRTLAGYARFLLFREPAVPANRITMRRIREVLRLKHDCALPNAQIAAALGIAKGSVANYLAAAAAAGLTHSEAQALDDAALNGRLHPQRYVYPQFAVPDFGAIHRELRRKGVTLQLLWEEYRAEAQGVPYSRSRFCERTSSRQRLAARCDRSTSPARNCSSTTPGRQSADRPREWREHARPDFVAVWGASNYTYAEATATESKADWIAAHINALTYFGGAPALLVPDFVAGNKKQRIFSPASRRTMFGDGHSRRPPRR